MDTEEDEDEVRPDQPGEYNQPLDVALAQSEEWGGTDPTNVRGLPTPTAQAHAQMANQEQLRQQQHIAAANAAANGGVNWACSDDGNSGACLDSGIGHGTNQAAANVDPMYNPGPGPDQHNPLGFQPFKAAWCSGQWFDISHQGLAAGDMRPCRAFAIQIPVDFFQLDADAFVKMQAPIDQESRAFSYAVLVSALFGPLTQGWATGTLARATSAGRMPGAGGGAPAAPGADKRPLDSWDRYEFSPTSDPNRTYPSFQIGYEELPDEDEVELLAGRIWLYVYDPAFSITEVLLEMMKFEAAVQDGLSFGRNPTGSKKPANEEASKRKTAKLSCEDVRNVSQFAGLQGQYLINESCWKEALRLYAGVTTANPKGCPVHDDYDALNAADGGDRLMAKDPSDQFGSLSPWAPEHLLNAKRALTLSAGLTDYKTGLPLRVKANRLDPMSYFDDEGLGEAARVRRAGQLLLDRDRPGQALAVAAAAAPPDARLRHARAEPARRLQRDGVRAGVRAGARRWPACPRRAPHF